VFRNEIKGTERVKASQEILEDWDMITAFHLIFVTRYAMTT
jgi:hypothetical protein